MDSQDKAHILQIVAAIAPTIVNFQLADVAHYDTRSVARLIAGQAILIYQEVEKELEAQAKDRPAVQVS